MIGRAERREGRVRGMVRFYLTSMRISISQRLQYRMGTYLWMVGMVVEPVIYLVVWSTIARSQGGVLEGYTAGDFAAYYIVWTLVRTVNIVFTPYGWEWRIREGELSGNLLRPLHPIHHDLASFAGSKLIEIVLWVPIAIALSVLFHPTLHPTVLGVLVFLVAIWGAYLIRSLLLWVLGMITLWTTRVSGIYELYFAAELLLSGRLVPITFMPHWAQTVAWFLPFQWTFGFPILALIGTLSNAQLLEGLGMQALWVAVGWTLMTVVWRRGVRRYSAVGG